MKNILKLSYASCIALFLIGCSNSFSLNNASVYYPSRDFKTDKTIKKGAKATMKPYTINGKTYYPSIVEIGEKAEGIASWYGPGFHGKKTSSGEIYDQNSLTAAHKTLPMNTILKVTNLKNNKEVIVRVNDRGPFVANRIIDLSNAAAYTIDMVNDGTAPVKLEVIGFGNKASGNVVVNNNNYEGGKFMVQIGAFKNKTGAQNFALKYKNYKTYSSLVQSSATDDLNRVFITGFRSEEEARDFAQNGEFAGAFIVREE